MPNVVYELYLDFSPLPQLYGYMASLHVVVLHMLSDGATAPRRQRWVYDWLIKVQWRSGGGASTRSYDADVVMPLVIVLILRCA